MTALRDFKAAVRTAVLSLPEGFSQDDLARKMGGDYSANGDPRDRLRRWVKNNAGGELLRRVGHGRYTAGPKLADEAALGAGPQLVGDIRQVFDDAGGVLLFRELLTELGLTDGTLVRRVLDDSPRYRSGTPLKGFQTAWYVADQERLDVPVPGRLMAFDVQMTAGGPRRDLGYLLEWRRGKIAVALAEARLLTRLEIDDIVKGAAVANAIDAAMRSFDVLRYGADGTCGSWSDWWAERVQRVGRPAALSEVWSAMESDDAQPLMAMTVRFWRAVGDRLGFSAALLSRGCVARAR